ncbi:MAG: hypothetical protein Kow0027_11490 [Saprospiraceae bacterium]
MNNVTVKKNKPTTPADSKLPNAGAVLQSAGAGLPSGAPSKRICVIGCGTLGSYLIRRLLDLYGGAVEIIAVEMGDHKIRNEEEMGVTAEAGNTNVASLGRYFGLGGTSARWGGQVLFFDERDNPENDPTWAEIIRINSKHQRTVLEQLLGNTARFVSINPEASGGELSASLKTGVWLRYNRRNLYKRMVRPVRSRVQLKTNRRIVGFQVEGNRIGAVVLKSADGKVEHLTADRFYLTAGALESCRLMLKLQADFPELHQQATGKNFGDHISTELFVVQDARPVLDGIDFTPQVVNGSLVTKRIVARAGNGMVGFVHFVFNKDIRAFKFLKEMLFGKMSTSIGFKDLLQGAGFLLRFAWGMLVAKRLYVHPGQWSVQLDMEQAVPNSNSLALADLPDRYGEPALRINWDISKKDKEAIADVRNQVEALLRRNKLKFTAKYDPAVAGNKVEDVYHPVGFLPVGSVVSMTGKVKGLENLWHFSTAMLPSARSINPTAAVMCHIEEHLEEEAAG